MSIKRIILSIFTLATFIVLPSSHVYAQPFGVGFYGADVPFGDLTSISIDLSAAVTINPTSVGGGLYGGSGSQTITVTSTDVIGYDLYINATTTTDMKNGGATILTTANSSPASLATNTWGYNTTGSTSTFKKITLSQVSIDTATGPYKNGRDTTVTYGVLIDNTPTSGTYTVDVTYTAVGQT